MVWESLLAQAKAKTELPGIITQSARAKSGTASQYKQNALVQLSAPSCLNNPRCPGPEF